MSIKHGVAQSLIRNDLSSLGAPGCDFELVVLGGAEAVARLFTVWDPAVTFEERARGERMSKAEALAATFNNELPIVVGAWRRRIRPDWVQAGGNGPDDMVIFDGNHRMLAMALRAAWQLPIPACVGVFVGL